MPLENPENALLLSDAETGLQTGNPFSFFSILRIFFVLVLVAGAIYALVFILKKSTKISAKNDPWLKVISTVPTTAHNSAALVSAGGKVYLLGCADGSVNVISELTDKETVDAMLLDVSNREFAAEKNNLRFGEILKKLAPSFSNSKNISNLNSVSSTEKLRAARARLGGI